MNFNGLNSWISYLERKGELIRIDHPVSTRLEITEITDRISKSPGGGKALLFTNNGTGFPLLINGYGSERRMSLALGHESLDQIGEEIESLFKQLSGPATSFVDKLKKLPMLGKVASYMPKSISGRGKCQQVIMEKPDLTRLPVLTCWPADGGPFITLPGVVTRDPETGIRNVGMYRMQVFDETTTGMHWHRHKTGARHYQQYKNLKRRMPVAVVLGGDPAYTYAATAPLPDQIDEYLLAGFLRKRAVELVKCVTCDLEVPSDADFIIEGYVDPMEDFVWEGPFGDHTGFYSLADWYPKFHVTAITHRKDAVYPATIVGIPSQEDAYIGLATERIFLAPMKLTLIPELKGMFLPPAGVAHNLTIAKIEKSYPGQAHKTISAMWGAGQMMFNKIMVVLDQHEDLLDFEAVGRRISERVNPLTDILFSKGPMDVLDHSSSRFAFGSKMGFDATPKMAEELFDTRSPLSLPDSGVLKELLMECKLVTAVNTNLLSLGISAVIIAFDKSSSDTLQQLKDEILSIPSIAAVKFIILVDTQLPVDSIESVVWYVTGNIDPERDCQIVAPRRPEEAAHLIVDGTRKSKEFDGFQRDWPNPVLSSVETIQKVDQMWESLGLGAPIVSPSLFYYGLKKGDGAIAG